ncbi:hypothetical protein AVEN_77800-1 [Araneus ventricosus]|uniref:Asparagine synthetase domain-containing protein 1 n=1 Tax=Araneus ventricosus TaxID=182803 RepID=A0A4Y2SSE4_ARAVE|nr:hypothetical protein AVEN_77800-1 [Araneus ventricosus]
MCGICISLSFRERSGDERQNDVVSQNLLARLKRRGPNHFETLSSSFSDVLDLHFISSVLQLRGGSSPSLQPVTDSSGNILLWNGEIFDETLVKC